MKILWNWLLEYCDIDRAISAPEGAAILTKAGLEVEALTDLGAQFSGVVVAKVVSKRPHPNSDKLNLVTVVTSADGPTTEVVCGAPNVPEPGRKVLWAQIGAKLPGGITLAAKAVKGIESPGMLCSEIELGIGDDDHGIVVLAADDQTPLGAPAQVALGVDDWLMEIKAPANRGDILSHVGMARELVSLVGGKVVLPNAELAPWLDASAATGTTVAIAAAARCQRYTARHIAGLTIAPSPRKFAQRLRNVGVRPISNVVDVTNYVMFELGQPLHAFDAATLTAGRMTVRCAAAGESFTTLDGVARTLESTDLLICDGERPVALAGVMGGQNSEVSATTSTVLLESACFEPVGVRRTARRLALHSESSHRFERNVDSELAAFASARAAFLLAQLTVGQPGQGAPRISPQLVDVYPTPRQVAPVRLRHARVTQLLGVPVAPAVAARLLTQLGCMITDASTTALLATPPTYRFDLAREVDLIEEVLRLGGYDTVPDSLPRLRTAPPVLPPNREEQARQALVAAGLDEAITFGFTSQARIDALGLPATDPRAMPIAIKNPMSIDHGVMRTSLLPNLLAALARNESFGHRDCALFEVGSIFLPKPRDASDGRDAGLAVERPVACGVLIGMRPAQMATTTAWDVFDAKGFAETAIAACAGAAVRTVQGEPVAPYLHPGISAALVLAGGGGGGGGRGSADTIVGLVGQVHPSVAERFHLERPVYMFEVYLDCLPVASPKQMQPIGKFPGTSRDISLLVADTVPAARAAHIVAAANHALVEGVSVLEEFKDAKLPPGTKSMLYSIRYRSLERTLTDADVEAAHTQLVAKLIEGMGATQR